MVQNSGNDNTLVESLLMNPLDISVFSSIPML